MTASSQTVTVELDAQYRALREQAGILERPEQRTLEVGGPDAAAYLQSQLTQEVESMAAGEGAYATLLDRKGHVQADMRVLRHGSEHFDLITEDVGLETLRRHLTTYLVGRDVQVGEPAEQRVVISVIGPAAAAVAGADPLGSEHAHRPLRVGGEGCELVATDLGLDLIVAPGNTGAVEATLRGAGAELVSAEAAEILRVESGRPRFGRDFDSASMPAEAGIVERAVNFTKGCYIGQEPVARLHYRGRPNRLLRGLRLSGPATAGAELTLGDRSVGTIGSACLSPALGPIALAIVRREADPGGVVTVGRDGIEAEVCELPFAS